MQEIVVEKLLDVQTRCGSEQKEIYQELEYCINMVAQGNLYKLQSEVLLDEDDEEETKQAHFIFIELILATIITTQQK